MTAPAVNDFGQVAEHGDSYEFHIDAVAGGVCGLVSVVQTERGPRRTEEAEIPAALWRKIGPRVVRELAEGLGESERTKAAPKLKTGTNRLSPLVGRELALLLWVLHEEGAAEQLEPILHGWRELAREERWWLYAKAAAPGQRTGTGWRRALFHALSEAAESRVAVSPAEKKSPAQVDSPRSSRRPRLTTRAQSSTITTTSPSPPVARRRKATVTVENPS